MPRGDRDLLLGALQAPGSLADLAPAEWGRLIPIARRAGVLPRLASLVAQARTDGAVPVRAREQLAAARPVAAQHARVLRWEVDRIRVALLPLRVQTVLLKGAAYIVGNLPAGEGRLSSDIDVLVARSRLDDVERALVAAGWEPMKLDPYDQRYYRRWSHELPPLRHRRRQSVVDVHHTILPPTGRLHPDPEKLLASAVPLDADGTYVLAPTDMVLHAATHLFQDGDLAGGLGELVDLDILLRHFGRENDFWQHLGPRARELDLARPLFYALRYCSRLLGTPVPASTLDAAAVGGPHAPLRSVMDALALRALVPDRDDEVGRGARLARWLLYLRWYWLRMPPWLLARHLAAKALRSRSTDNGTAGAAGGRGA